MEKEIKFNPTKNDLKEVKKWLKEEKEKSGKSEGFFCNWAIIKEAYNNKRFISLRLNKKAIGFCIWQKDEIYAKIDIFAIQLEYRRKGFGKFLFKNTINYLKQKNILLLKLFCEPRESEKFWRKMGFIKFPHGINGQPDLTFYKPLIKVKNTTRKPDALNKLELWDLEPYQINDRKPKWSWDIKNNHLLNPIILACNPDWNIRWTKNGKIINEEKIKRFSQNKQIIFGSFMFIKMLDF